MKIDVARLCLDCDEVHDSQKCPACASETFAYLRRWIPGDGRPKTRTPQPLPAPPPSVLPSKGRLVGFGIAGLGVWGLARWLSKGRELIERTAADQDIGELK
jgi:hypothetical protein